MDRTSHRFSLLTQELMSALTLDQLGVLISIDVNINATFRDFVHGVLLPLDHEKTKIIKALLLTLKNQTRSQQKMINDEIMQHIDADYTAAKRKMTAIESGDVSSPVVIRRVKPRTLVTSSAPGGAKSYEADNKKLRELDLKRIVAKKVQEMLLLLNCSQWVIFFDELKNKPDNHETLWEKFSGEYSEAFACISTIFDKHWLDSDVILQKIIKKIRTLNTHEIKARTGDAWHTFLTVLSDSEDTVSGDASEDDCVAATMLQIAGKPLVFSDKRSVSKLDVLVFATKHEMGL